MSKNSKELKAFNEAKRIRADLISSLEKCKTAGRFKEIMLRQQNDKRDGLFHLQTKI